MRKGILYKAGETWLVEYFNSSESPEGTTMHWGTLPVLPIQADHLQKIYEPTGHNEILFTMVDVPREQHGNLWVQKYAHIITEVDTKELTWNKVWTKWELERSSWDGFWELKKWLEKNFEINNKS
jgi:hypothetical protein